MKIGGFQKTSLLDYPNKISSIVWIMGCNFRCPFCYNKRIVFEKGEIISEKRILSFLNKRKGMLEGLSISGGEPLLHIDIIDFIKKVKKLNYLIKIDTNGAFPERLVELINNNIVDYIAMDVKAPKNKYDYLTGVKTEISKIEQSIDIIRNKAPDYEFKTTVIPKLLEKKDIMEIAKWLGGSKRYYLQQFKNDTQLISSDLSSISPYSKKKLNEILEEIKPFFKESYIRGV